MQIQTYSGLYIYIILHIPTLHVKHIHQYMQLRYINYISNSASVHVHILLQYELNKLSLDPINMQI